MVRHAEVDDTATRARRISTRREPAPTHVAGGSMTRRRRMQGPHPLCRAFLEHVDPSLRPDASEALEHALNAHVARARAAWPGVELDPEAYVEFVARRVAAEARLEDLHTEDLYLVAACLRGVPEALDAFEQALGEQIDRGLRGLAASELADASTRVRQRLLTAADGPPKLASYGGRGRLLHWLRITVVRMRKDFIRVAARRRDRPATDEALVDHAVSPIASPEYAYLKGHYAQMLQEELVEALRELSPRLRNYLRQHLVEGLSTAQLAAVYGVDASTTRRWLSRARDDLWLRTRRRMMVRLRLSQDELESIVRLVRSELDVSVVRLLRDPPPP